MTRNSRISSSFCRMCRYVGLCGTLAGHGALLLPVWLLMHQADTALPEPLEAPVIALHVVPAPAPPAPQTAPPLSTPEPQPPDPPVEPEKSDPIPEPEHEPDPIPEPPPPPLPALEKVEIPPPQEKPKERPARKPPPPPVRSPARASPVAPHVPDATVATAAAEAQAKQTLLSYLMAQFEKYKYYPASARKLGLEGVVRVSVSIHAGGAIASIQLKGDEIHPVLHKAAAETIEKIRRNWQPPPTDHAVSIVIPLRYKLVDK